MNLGHSSGCLTKAGLHACIAKLFFKLSQIHTLADAVEFSRAPATMPAMSFYRAWLVAARAAVCERATSQTIRVTLPTIVHLDNETETEREKEKQRTRERERGGGERERERSEKQLYLGPFGMLYYK